MPIYHYNDLSFILLAWYDKEKNAEERVAMSRKPKANPQHGRKANQKMKPYLVMEYLMRHTDENHAESADNIAAYLQELGIVVRQKAELNCGATPHPMEL